MRKLLCLSLLLATGAQAEGPWVAVLTTSGTTSVNTVLSKNTDYVLQCTAPVRFRTGNGSTTAATTTDDTSMGLLYDTALLPFKYFSTQANSDYVAIIPDPAASVTCRVFRRY